MRGRPRRWEKDSNNRKAETGRAEGNRVSKRA